MKALSRKTVTTALVCLCFTGAAQEQIYSTVKNAYFELTAIVQKANGGTNMARHH